MQHEVPGYVRFLASGREISKGDSALIYTALGSEHGMDN